jgi:hypothetical protein
MMHYITSYAQSLTFKISYLVRLSRLNLLPKQFLYKTHLRSLQGWTKPTTNVGLSIQLFIPGDSFSQVYSSPQWAG